LPNDPFAGNDFAALCRLIQQYDLVILQRCFKYEVFAPIKAACELLGVKCVFETDDDYFNIPPSNPCYAEVSTTLARTNYAKILSSADAVTVSTEELANIIRPFNPNVHVFPNNMENVMCGDFLKPCRGYSAEKMDGKGNTIIEAQHGMVVMPAFFREKQQTKIHRTIRLGYSCTPSHREDFKTIKFAPDKIMKKYEGRIWLFLMGDVPLEKGQNPWFQSQMTEGAGRIVSVPPQQYMMYLYQLRNIDIGLAPLIPDIFNMSKSPIKAIEYASWGIPAVLPNFITYTREFTHEKNSLMYYNSGEFQGAVEELINNDDLRERLGAAARDHVVQNRLERLHSQERFEFYQGLIAAKRFKQFHPTPVEA